MCYMVILLVIDDGAQVCICKVYYSVFKEYTQHAFFYDSHFSQLEKSECCGAIVDNISYAPICVLEENNGKIKAAINNILRNSLMALALWIMLSKLLQIIFDNISWIFINYFTEY